MSALPFMPLYVGDYLADTAHLTTEQHGAYLLLLMAYWRHGGPLPADDRKLARIVKMDPRKWAKHKDAVLDFFVFSHNNFAHTRADEELAKAKAKSLRNKKGGLARAASRLSLEQAQAKVKSESQPLPISPNGDIGRIADNSPPDSDTEFWANAKAYLGPSKASVIGKWCRDYGQVETAKAIAAAQAERAVDPVPYIQAVLRKQHDDGWEFEMPC